MGTRIVAPGSEAQFPQYAHHTGRITLTHADTEPDERIGGHSGATTWWKDGTTSYVLHFRGGPEHGHAMADETDTAIQALDSLREGEPMSGDRLWAALRDVRRLRNRLEALESELILYAREDDPQGRARMSLREIGEVTNTHHTTVAERVDRMRAGTHAPFRRWLVQGTDREAMHGGATTRQPRVPTLREQLAEAPGGAFLAEAIPMDPGGYVITVTNYTPEPEQLLRIDLPDWDNFRSASAGHRLIEQGFQVLPAAHYESDRAAGWKPGVDGLTYSAPVYRLPEAD
ncbi:AsnC family protein [Streptomyces canus]|uniref:AsnC family protein n=1 Tax=Streptomyces canus TaxID=58343 RepID=UPI002F90E6ED|nr:AsnC family protein [Streptomyces canus]